MAFKQCKHLEGTFVFQENLQNNIYWHKRRQSTSQLPKHCQVVCITAVKGMSTKSLPIILLVTYEESQRRILIECKLLIPIQDAHAKLHWGGSTFLQNISEVFLFGILSSQDS